MGNQLISLDANIVADEFRSASILLEKCVASDSVIPSLLEIVKITVSVLRNGGRIFIAGNGGSAADAQHIAGEFLSRLAYDRAPLPAVALTTDSSVLTAVGNDYGFEYVFSRQLHGLGTPNDLFLGISTSGRSKNILNAFEAAKEKGMRSIGFSGEYTAELDSLCDVVFAVPSRSTPQIQQIHIVAAHIVCGIVESTLFPRQQS